MRAATALELCFAVLTNPDLKELRKIIGVKHCPNCIAVDYARRVPIMQERSAETMRIIVSEAREAMLGGATAAAVQRILNRQGFSRAHALFPCPLLWLPHFGPDGLVPERLHERYVRACLLSSCCYS